MNIDLSNKAFQAFKEGMKFKEKRMKEGNINLEYYNLKQQDEKVGFLSIPTTDMHSFVEDYKSRMPKLNINYKAIKSLADADAERKINALHKRDSLPQFADYESGNRAVNHYATIYGVGIAKVWSESVNGYKHHFDVVDPLDFFCQPYGGSNLETHKYCGEMGIYLTKTQLEKGEKDGIYKNVKDLITKIGESSYANRNDYDSEYKKARFPGTGTDVYKSHFDELYHFFEIDYEYEGDRYYELIEVNTGISIRQEKLVDIFASGLYPYCTWSPLEDKHNFWTLAPADVKRPTAILNQENQNAYINNVRQLVRPYRAYKPEAFDRPPKYIPDGWLAMKKGSNLPINDAVQRIDVVDLTASLIKFSEYLRQSSGLDTGVTQGMQGESETDKVGINERNIQQANKKLMYSNEAHNNFAIEVGKRWLYGARENLDNKTSVKVLGALGLETVKVLKTDAEVEFDIEIEDLDKRNQLDEIKAQKTLAALNHPTVLQNGNPKKIEEIVLKLGGLNDNEVSEIMDIDNFGEGQYIEKAENVFQQFIEGSTPEPYRNANAIFCQRLQNLLMDNKDKMKPNLIDKVQKYIDFHTKIATVNASIEGQRDLLKSQIQQAKQFLQNPEVATGAQPITPQQPETPQEQPEQEQAIL